jgi:hypothetical protein
MKLTELIFKIEILKGFFRKSNKKSALG